MRLYYTTSQEQGAEQVTARLSIGGQRSGTPLPNGRLNNLFGDITNFTANSNTDKFIGLILLNESGGQATNVRIWFTYPDGAQAKFLIAAVSLSNGSMERLLDNTSEPLIGEFYEADGEANAVTVGNIADGAAVGIWIQRKLDLDAIKAVQTDGFYERDTETQNQYKEVELPTEEEIIISIDYV